MALSASGCTPNAGVQPSPQTRSSPRTARRGPPERMGRSGRGRSEHPGLRHRHQRRPGREKSTSRSRRTPPTTGSTSTGSVTTAATGRARSRPSSPPSRCPKASPTASTRRHGPDRLRQLGGVGVVAGARRPPSSGIYIAKLVREDGPPERATSSSSSATTTGTRTCCSRPRTRPGRPTTATAATASTPAGRGQIRARLQGQLQPPVQDARDRARGLALQRRVPDGALARAQRLRRQLLHRRRHRPARGRDPANTRASSRSATTSTGRASSAIRSRPPATRASTWASSAATRVFWKTRWEAGLDRPRPATGRWSPTRRRTQTRKIDPQPNVWTGTWRDPRPFNPEGAQPGERVDRDASSWSTPGRRRSRCRRKTARCASGGTRALPRQAPGETATLAANTLGYEWDEDLDNGARPPGCSTAPPDQIPGPSAERRR